MYDFIVVFFRPGSNQDSPGQATCVLCPQGYYCQPTPIRCPRYHYCPAGVTVPIPCPNGTFTYDNMTGLANASQCLPCITGHYCRLGQIISTCMGGFFCKSGSPDPNPDGYWPPVEAGPCPMGYFCPNGTKAPLPCPDNTMKNYTGGTGYASDCLSCPAGRYCVNGKIIRVRA